MSRVTLWTPSVDRLQKARMTAFLKEVSTSEPAVRDFPSLYRWSIDQPRRFWPAVWDFCDIQSSQPWSEVVRDLDAMPGARWFPDARLNFAENLLRFRDDRPALVCYSELGMRQQWSYSELYGETARIASGLRDAGVTIGDRVAGYLPNIPQGVAAMLATSSLGAVWSSCSPDFGVRGVLDRFGQIQPKVLFCADGYRWAGKPIDSLPRVAEILEQLADIETVVVVRSHEANADISHLPRAVDYAEFGGNSFPEITFSQLPFDHPLYIMYSSGTTGLPKCMVHGAGGTLLQHLKELVLHTDLTRDDSIFYYTTCGWMMWNWLVSSLAVGASVVLYDGSPFHPREDSLLEMAVESEITIFGTSAKYLALAEKRGVVAPSGGLPQLRTILSTGSPLAPQSFDYVYKSIKSDVCLSSISGGTDIISCFALGNPTGPVVRGELQTRGLGMRVEIFDGNRHSLVGRPGELVCTQPFPSMPVSFWNDPAGEKYRRAYFSHYPGVWRHGDWAELTPAGGMIIYGRSDATLNPGGVRIGTAEIYRQVEKLEEVLESLVVDQQWEGDVRIVLFVRLRDGLSLDEELVNRIQQIVRQGTSPHHVPRRILQVTDIPRTISGKITELAVRNVLHGQPIENRDALANPEALEQFMDRPELQQ